MAIVTALAIETDIHLSGIEPGIDCKELVTSLLRRCLFLARDTLCSVTVETGEATQVLASCASNVGCIDTGGWGGVFPRSSSFLVSRYPHMPIRSIDQGFPANHLSGAAR